MWRSGEVIVLRDADHRIFATVERIPRRLKNALRVMGAAAKELPNKLPYRVSSNLIRMLYIEVIFNLCPACET